MAGSSGQVPTLALKVANSSIWLFNLKLCRDLRLEFDLAKRDGFICGLRCIHHAHIGFHLHVGLRAKIKIAYHEGFAEL